MKTQIEEDLLITALEGGSNYWYYLPDLSMTKKYREEGQATSERIFKAAMSGEIIPVHDAENEEEFLGNISKENFIKAETLMKENSPQHYANAISENSDAETADVWFQYVVLGEITFG
jgi:hypothetical protein